MRKQIVALGMMISILCGGGHLKQEQTFKPPSSYTLSDFHFAKPILYMDMASFYTKHGSDGEHFELRKDYKIHTIFKVGRLSFSAKRTKHDFDYLAHAILHKDYFWKRGTPLLWSYDFTTLRFVEKGDPRLKAITEKQDILDLFGEIDTPAELYVWLKANYPYDMWYFFKGWKEEHGLYRIHFKGLNNFCIYDEHYDYFDRHGKKVKTKSVKHYRKKGCVEALL